MQQISTFEREQQEKARVDASGLRAALTWALLSVGFCLVAFAQPLGVEWVAVNYGSDFSRSNASREHMDAASLTVRSVGFLLFASGLVERILIRFDK